MTELILVDENDYLTTATTALKENVKNWIADYKMVNDVIDVLDGSVVNIGINFDIVVLPNFINTQVLSNCITALQTYFNINNWQINQPIILRELNILLDRIEGVQTVKNVEISNFVGTNLGYSPYAYDISGATKNGVIYPSLDPMIFEVKYPSTDIQGRVVSL
mgnify:CR=1 FL=1